MEVSLSKPFWRYLGFPPSWPSEVLFALSGIRVDERYAARCSSLLSNTRRAVRAFTFVPSFFLIDVSCSTDATLFFFLFFTFLSALPQTAACPLVPANFGVTWEVSWYSSRNPFFPSLVSTDQLQARTTPPSPPLPSSLRPFSPLLVSAHSPFLHFTPPSRMERPEKSTHGPPLRFFVSTAHFYCPRLVAPPYRNY